MSIDHREMITTNPNKKVPKVTSRVLISSANNIIVGYLHGFPGMRLTDLLNSNIAFLPVTNVTVFTTQKEVLYKSGFIALNKNTINFVMELRG